jgi:adenylate kinase
MSIAFQLKGCYTFTIMNINPSMYVLFGRPGAGKGTFTQTFLSDGYVPISTGDITRKEIQLQTHFGIKYKEAILNHMHTRIPTEEIQKIVEPRLEDALQNQKGAILDGYPRTVEQCLLLDQFIEKFSLEDRIVYLFLDVEEEEAIERILYRQSCAQCDKIYHSKWSPPRVKNTCDFCYGKLYRRPDIYAEGMEGIKKRVYTFKERLHPVLDYYKNSLTLIDTNAPLKECIDRFLKIHRSFQLEKQAPASL